MDRCETAFPYGKFTVSDGYLCIDVGIGKVGHPASFDYNIFR